MADVVTNVTNLDIQLVDANRADATTVKLDNPKPNVTREQVSAAMQPALSNGWLLTNKGSVAMYIGDITINQSIKTKLGGQDFYVTPNSLTLSANDTEEIAEGTLNVTGATIQGTDIIVKKDNDDVMEIFSPVIAENGLSATVKVRCIAYGSPGEFDFVLIVQGEKVSVPCIFTVPNN